MKDLCATCDIAEKDYDPSDPEYFCCSDCACYQCIYTLLRRTVCQKCIFRLYGADHWKCNIEAFDLREVLWNIESKKKK